MNMVRVGIAVIVVSLFPFRASAQTSAVSGRVVDREGAPVADADVPMIVDYLVSTYGPAAE